MPRLRTPDSLPSRAALAAPTAPWPAERWWTAYGDPQLDRLIDEAMEGSPDLAAASARLAMAEALTQVAGSARKPQAGVQASATEEKLSYNYLTPHYMTPEGWNDYGRVALDVRWELDFWGRHRAALAAATSEGEARRAELAQVRLVLAAGVASEYAELSRLVAQRETAVKAVEVRRKTSALLAKRLDFGLETRAGVGQADARRAMAEGGLLALEEQIALQRNRLAALLGAGPDRGLAITDPTLRVDRTLGLPGELGSHLLGRRPDIVAARLQVEAQASRIRQARAEFYPSVNLSALVGVQALGLDMLTRDGSRIAGAGPALSLPLFSGGRLRGQLRGAEARYGEAVATYQGALVRALQEVADNAVGQRALGPRLLKAREAVEAATEAHRVVGNRYRGGLATYLEVLSAEDGLLESLRAQTDLGARSLVLDIGLQRALGGGY